MSAGQLDGAGGRDALAALAGRAGTADDEEAGEDTGAAEDEVDALRVGVASEAG